MPDWPVRRPIPAAPPPPLRSVTHRSRNGAQNPARANVRKKQNEIPMAAISGCIKNATSSSGTACHRFPSRMRHTASRIMAVARLRGCKCWSAMYSAVPATGSVNIAATSATAPHRALSSRKQQVRDFLDCPQNQKQRRQLPNQLCPRQRHPGPAHKMRHPRCRRRWLASAAGKNLRCMGRVRDSGPLSRRPDKHRRLQGRGDNPSPGIPAP